MTDEPWELDPGDGYGLPVVVPGEVDKGHSFSASGTFGLDDFRFHP